AARLILPLFSREISLYSRALNSEIRHGLIKNKICCHYTRQPYCRRADIRDGMAGFSFIAKNGK
ncbi:hypothetical protein, partial [Enterobacter chuandaensis]|uniref:hypothetical protein n=1 Tax=Enterobacter chuandaensis TaxID=2497875 RepID=UPI002119E3F3